jgi:hypothetical protein
MKRRIAVKRRKIPVASLFPVIALYRELVRSGIERSADNGNISSFVLTATLVMHSQLSGLAKEGFLYVIREVKPDIKRLGRSGRDRQRKTPRLPGFICECSALRDEHERRYRDWRIRTVCERNLRRIPSVANKRMLRFNVDTDWSQGSVGSRELANGDCRIAGSQ